MRLAKPQLSVWAACAIGPPKPIWIGRSSKTLAGSDVEPGGAESAHLVGVTVVEEDAGSGVHSCDGGHLAAIVGELVLKSPEFACLWRHYDVHGHTRGHKKTSATQKSATSHWATKA
jgi:hypothetical protein